MIQMLIIIFLVIATMSSTYSQSAQFENEPDKNAAEIMKEQVYKNNDTISHILANAAVNVFQLQNNVGSTPNTFQKFIIVILFEYSMWRTSLSFMEKIEEFRQGTQFISLQFGKDNSSIKNVTATLDILMRNETKVNSVVIFSDDHNKVIQVQNIVTSTVSLKWTSVIHLTEWIIIHTSSGIHSHLQDYKFNLDFVTLVSIYNLTLVSIFQKSRGCCFKAVLEQPVCDKSMDQNTTACVSSSESRDQVIRLHPLLFLQSKKSIMDGLEIPVAISARNYTRISYKNTTGNSTVYGGFTIELLSIMSHILGFSLNFVSVTDGGGYGEVLANGTITGITGLLARRETGIAALVSKLESRSGVIDFLPTILMEETVNIVYRPPTAADSLDLTYIKIIQDDLLLSLVGPVILIAVIGAVVHVITAECTSPKPGKISKRNLRSLRTFPSHIFFMTDNYAGQTGRILIGTWATFCVILWSAYSAYLVTTFATKPNELAIRTLQQLLQQTEFRIGMLGSGNALAIILKNSNEKYLQQIWNRMIEFNSSDSLTFSSEVADHVRKVDAGKYAFIDNFSLASGLFYDVPSNYTDVRAYPVTNFQETEASYVAIPKRVFYKQVLYNLQLDLEMAGIILKLRIQYFSNNKQDLSRTKHDNNVVDFGRIEFLVYVVVAMIVVSSACLAVELGVTWSHGRERREI